MAIFLPGKGKNMFNIKVSEILWNQLSAVEKTAIISHLRKFGVLKPEQHIVADPDTPALSLLHTDPKLAVDAALVDWICKSICMSTGAEASCIRNGQSTKECLANIRRSREIFCTPKRLKKSC